jgi:hypothetical protein
VPRPLVPKHLQQLRLHRNLRLVVLQAAGRHWRGLAFGHAAWYALRTKVHATRRVARTVEKLKASVRVKVEHPCRVVKPQFWHTQGALLVARQKQHPTHYAVCTI